MEATYFNRLPEDVQELVCEIERDAQIEIAVVVDAARQSLACETDGYGATIKIPADDAFPEASVLHELFHIKRFLIARVPKLVVCDDVWVIDPERFTRLENGLHDLDNNIEHLFIVPEELGRRPLRRDWWEPKFMRPLQCLIDGQFNGDVERKNLAFIGWVSIKHILGDCALLDQATVMLRELGLLLSAEALYGHIRAAHSKEEVVRFWLKAIELPLEGICFQYIDTRTQATNEVPLL